MGMVAGELQGDAFLHANLEYLASLEPPAISPVLPRLPGGAGLLPDDFQLPPTAITGDVASIILQVNAVEDVSLPMAQRLRAMAPPATATMQENETEHPTAVEDEAQQLSVDEMLRSMESDEPASQRRGRRQRLLRLTLTDGFTRVIAVEDCRKGCDALRGGVAWGAKLRLFAPLQIRHGVLILKSQQTVMMGGFVLELQEFWEQHAKAMLEEMSGRPKRRIQQPVEGPARVTPVQSYSGAHTNVEHLSASLPPPPVPQQRQQETEAEENAAAAASAAPSHSNAMASLHAASVVNQPPLLSFSLSASQPQSLSAWQSHHPPTAPFRTVAVIREVTSELTIREVAARSPEASKRFSLLVLLSTPPADVTSDVPMGEAELVVDLGHNWLQQALGVDPDTFRALFLSRQPDDVARLNTLVESVGWKLENFGVAVFVLRQRETDGVVEVVNVERL
ncbi:apurinic/apyrimidinic endonuclease [Trypanosoma cruzi marinkellei]|uniref:RecQ-mediated genome instability protein 1 n=1 Tax=Trypanosoma cruzi marinkellei TaxID=85056 RepID=K2N8N6_TRYCR|nr:apurinic/apyrimidinic endonuclease [Trypanosoma cruzi marinkellei]